MTDHKNSVRGTEPHLNPVVCLEQSAGIPEDGKDRMRAALGESKFNVGHEKLWCLKRHSSTVI